MNPPPVAPSPVGHDGDTALAVARERGAAIAAAFDTTLAARERAERSALLSRPAPPREAGGATSAEVLRLRGQVEHLTAFRTAVLGSRGWRALQGLRRLAGRAW
jgi:hypothetical protein